MNKKNKKFIIANWKMKLTHQQSIDLAEEMVEKYKGRDDLEVVICPTFTALSAVGEIIKRAKGTIKLGAQDTFYHNVGSYTGEVSPSSLADLGCEYVIVGHSERRKLGESDDDVNRKIQAAVKNKLIPVVCVGETFEEYNEKKTDVVIINQVTKALEDIKLKSGQRIIIAYEPVWVIGSGQAVEHDIVGQIAQIILHATTDLDIGLVDKFDVIYGGSVDSNNVNDFIMGRISTGVIVGNSSLKASSFLKLLDNIK